MSDILCVTNRALCKGDFLERIESLARAHPAGILLREKDLAEEDYRMLAGDVMEICKRNHVLCILHNFVNVAKELNCPALHLPLHVLRTMSENEKAEFSILGASCHSPADAVLAERLGCTYITAGHIFDTDCKKGMPGRGLEFLRNVCESVSIPVYAIGGINAANIAGIRRNKAAGACIMSGTMVCEDIEAYLLALEEEVSRMPRVQNGEKNEIKKRDAAALRGHRPQLDRQTDTV